MRKLYLGVGINSYAQSPLRGCVNDVGDMFGLLCEKYGFRLGNDMRLLLEGRATTDEIMARLQWLAHCAEEGDVCVFQYSGHGSQVPTRTDTGEVDGMDEIICPHDFSWDGRYITDNDLGGFAQEIRAKGAFPFFLVDSCHSGTITRNFGLPFDIIPIFFEAGDIADDLRIKYGIKFSIPWGVRYLAPPGDIIARMTEGLRPRRPEKIHGAVISGCRDDQTSADAYIDGRFNGAMTRALIDILASAEGNRLTISELAARLPCKVEERNFEQVPQVVFEEGSENRFVFC